MNKDMPTVMKYRINDFAIEVCHGAIPDVCRLLWFGPITELELPDTKESDESFYDWLNRYRKASEWVSDHLIRMSQCN